MFSELQAWFLSLLLSTADRIKTNILNTKHLTLQDSTLPHFCVKRYEYTFVITFCEIRSWLVQYFTSTESPDVNTRTVPPSLTLRESVFCHRIHKRMCSWSCLCTDTLHMRGRFARLTFMYHSFLHACGQTCLVTQCTENWPRTERKTLS